MPPQRNCAFRCGGDFFEVNHTLLYSHLLSKPIFLRVFNATNIS